MTIDRSSRIALEKLLIAAVLYSVIGFGYLIVNHMVEGRELHELWTPMDRTWPFRQEFIWIYNFVYIVPLAIVLFVPRIQEVRKAGLALACNALVAFPIFVVYPVTMPRPEDRLVLDWSGYMTDFIWQIDRPINCFPSIHVSVAFTVAFVVNRFSRLAGSACLLAAVAISVSTLYVRQHYVLDIVAGIALGAGSYWLVFVRGFAEQWAFFRSSGEPAASS